MKRIVILGAGESGAGAAVLAKKEGFDVFVSDMSAIKDKYKKLLDDHAIDWEEKQHTEEKILSADEIIKSPGIPKEAPMVKKAIEKELAEKGIELMDAPVSGGEPKAIDGTLSVMVGGKEETFQKYYDLLKTMAASVTYVGPLGSGNVAKLANQVIVAINIAAVSEALTLAVKNGADPEKVYSAIRGGLAGSTVLDAKAPMMMAHNFKPGFRIELHIKDLNNALNAAHATSTALPLTAEVMEMMQALKNDGCAAEDHSALVRYYEKISAVSVEK